MKGVQIYVHRIKRLRGELVFGTSDAKFKATTIFKHFLRVPPDFVDQGGGNSHNQTKLQVVAILKRATTTHKNNLIYL